MKHNGQIAAFILAGGASSRMGRNKSLLKLAGVPLVVRTARLLEPLVSKVTVVGPIGPYIALGLDAIDDRIPSQQSEPVPQQLKRRQSLPRQGPLAGITRALSDTSAPWNLIVAGDLPYLSGQWISWLLSRAIDSKAQVVIPRTRHGLEPLAAVYRRECARLISAAFFGGVRKVSEGLAGLRLETIDAYEWAAINPDGRVLKNMNTPEDYAEARKWRSSEDKELPKAFNRLRPKQESRGPTAPRRNK